MADAEMAANLTCFMAALLREQHGIAEISHALLCSLQKVPAAKMAQALQRVRGL
jgi:DNA polymerase-3 subunit epsilon